MPLDGTQYRIYGVRSRAHDTETQGVADLVRDVLATIPSPYSEDIIEDVVIAIEQHPQGKQRYAELSADLRAWVVNN
jgi:hypothetical protein